jgi:hypothetical protein
MTKALPLTLAFLESAVPNGFVEVCIDLPCGFVLEINDGGHPTEVSVDYIINVSMNYT